ncbi:uncharacterized protein LOC111056373 [Nilaparvata lugens]|uniref:uncharacterized protein LOC111056373 n=1 Tax=Nilaparvata lugens TaxID=108931 RepID=UPI00193DB789|nr:uncharacterized protein LOC111056373 [Nilaparvata lugens]
MYTYFQAWEEIFFQKMKENADEEKRLALEKGNMFHGVPFITVIGDGGWAKRSYGHGMNSSGGVGVIIGAETKKILFIGVRNKFCFSCANPKKKNAEHVCYKNYTGPSTGMESSIIVEGFRRSEEDYGLIYKNYIGDGDSSVYAKIQEGCSYGRYVQKIECANHVTRALNDNLHKVAENTQFPLSSRKLLSKPAPGETVSRLERIVKGVRTAIKEAGVNRNAQDMVNLRATLKNAPDHVFGNHNKCGTFCKRKELNEENVLPEIDVVVMSKIRTLIGNVESKAESLVFNETTNIAERYMGCVAKFTGGKRVNFSTGGSFKRRCVGAGLAHTAGSGWHLSPWKKFKNKSPGAIFKKKILMREKRSMKRKLLFEVNQPKRKRRVGGGGYDAEYGPLAVKADIDVQEMMEKSEHFLQELRKDVEFGNLKLNEDTIGQHTNALWREKRISRLTASKFGAVAKRLDHTPCHNLVKSIIIKRPLYTEAVTFGRDNEEKAIKLYEDLTKSMVKKCGLFVDLEDPFLGASPDGLIGDDGLIEVKCLHSVKELGLKEHLSINRNTCLEIVDNNMRLKRKHDYYYQVQGQLNITNRQWCDFVVFTRKGELFVERIERDQCFWRKVLPKLKKFYLECIVPEIVDSRLVRGLRIRDPPFIMEAQKKQKEKQNEKKN